MIELFSNAAANVLITFIGVVLFAFTVMFLSGLLMVFLMSIGCDAGPLDTMRNGENYNDQNFNP